MVNADDLALLKVIIACKDRLHDLSYSFIRYSRKWASAHALCNSIIDGPSRCPGITYSRFPDFPDACPEPSEIFCHTYDR